MSTPLSRVHPGLVLVITWSTTLVACWLLAGQQPPHVNEAHYLCKAKHFYEPDFAQGDLFLESRDAHWLFFATFGRLADATSLEHAAWMGRLVTWSFIAAGLVALVVAGGVPPWWTPWATLATLALWQLSPMAGEWVVGGVEGKGPAFACALVALALAIRGRWKVALVIAGGATAWHVLVGGWTAILIAAAVLRAEGRTAFMSPSYWLAGMLSAGLAAVGILPALTLMQGAAPGTAQAAAQIYVYERLSHHLIFQRFPPYLIARHLMLWAIFAGLYLTQTEHKPTKRLGSMVGSAAAIMLIGIALSIVSEWHSAWAARWLRFYWFRTSDWVLPPATALLATRAASRHASTARAVKWGTVAAASVFLLWIAYQESDYRVRDIPPAMRQSGLARRMSDDDARRAAAEWRATCRWIRQHVPNGETFLTPRRQQTFKWYAARAEVVNWKDVPQDAKSLLEWYRRYQDVFPPRVLSQGITAHGTEGLQTLGDRYGARWVLVDRRRSRRDLPWPPAYPRVLTEETRFAVYRIPNITSDVRPPTSAASQKLDDFQIPSGLKSMQR